MALAVAAQWAASADSASARTASRHASHHASRHASHRASHQRRARARLLRRVRKNPRVVLRRSFLRRAGQVHFSLPVTVRLRGSNNTAPASPVYADLNPNSATIDLGTSLGTRQVSLGGSLPAEIVFSDQFDGGGAGNVTINLSGNSLGGGLTTTSIPLLWNDDVSTDGATHQWWGMGFDGGGGCGGFEGDADLPTPITQIGLANGIAELSQNGIPYFAPTANQPSDVDPEGVSAQALAFQAAIDDEDYLGAASQVAGFIPVIPGVDSTSALKTSGETTPLALGSDPIDNMGLNPDPFPTSDDPDFDPLDSQTGPNVRDTVLRTAPITLRVAPAGTEVQQVDDSFGVDGSQNLIIGRSGGQANLFGNIPGKDHSIDVTVSLEGKINTILRLVDQDYAPSLAGRDLPPSALECRQVFTGAVQNYFPGIRLVGDVQMSPGITKDGFERIATATLSGDGSTQFAVAACLYPYSLFAAEANSSDTTAPPVPVPPLLATSRRAVPVSTGCGETPTAVVRALGLGARNLTDLATEDDSGYTTSADGSRVSIATLLDVNNVSADILIGKHQG